MEETITKRDNLIYMVLIIFLMAFGFGAYKLLIHVEQKRDKEVYTELREILQTNGEITHFATHRNGLRWYLVDGRKHEIRMMKHENKIQAVVQGDEVIYIRGD